MRTFCGAVVARTVFARHSQRKKHVDRDLGTHQLKKLLSSSPAADPLLLDGDDDLAVGKVDEMGILFDKLAAEQKENVWWWWVCGWRLAS